MLKVAFYDPSSDRLLQREKFGKDLAQARFTAVMLADVFASGRHRMPSPYWVVWDHKSDVLSVFYLAQTGEVDGRTYERIRALVEGQS